MIHLWKHPDMPGMALVLPGRDQRQYHFTSRRGQNQAVHTGKPPAHPLSLPAFAEARLPQPPRLTGYYAYASAGRLIRLARRNEDTSKRERLEGQDSRSRFCGGRYEVGVGPAVFPLSSPSSSSTYWAVLVLGTASTIMFPFLHTCKRSRRVPRTWTGAELSEKVERRHGVSANGGYT